MAGVWNTFYERLEEAEICATVEMFGSLVWKVRSHGIQGELALGYKIGMKVGDRVVVEGYFTERRPVTRGIRQGLMLGPLSFGIDINNLH